ncbi:MAG: class I SAM-dependent methyltransferase [Phycisphaerales bacterium]|nr:MAG: class I SAM-dependent methyltransferase [Phycisphaerales bacterium]
MGLAKSIDGNRLQQIKDSLRNSYTKQSATYDAQRTISANGKFFFEVAYQTIDELIGPTDEDTVHVDMPCGTGRFLFYLCERGRTHNMLGVDLSPGMLRTCQHKAGERSKTVSLVMGDAFRLPLANDSVDILTSMRFFHLFPRRYWPALLAETYRVIRPGGFLIAEMRNLFRGVAGALYVEYRDRWFYGGRRRSYVWPHQVGGLFRRWACVESRGVGLDGLARLSAVAPGPARRLHGLTRYPLCRHLAKELVVKAYKPLH